jgi:hypothetical protein
MTHALFSESIHVRQRFVDYELRTRCWRAVYIKIIRQVPLHEIDPMCRGRVGEQELRSPQAGRRRVATLAGRSRK